HSWPKWLSATVVFLFSGVALYGWTYWPSKLYDNGSQITKSRFRDAWWPPRLSSFVVLIGTCLILREALSHPPLGRKSAISLCNLVIGIGIALRLWED